MLIIHFYPDLILAQTVSGGSVVLIVIVVIVTFILIRGRHYTDNRYRKFGPPTRNNILPSLNPLALTPKMPPSGVKILAEKFDFYRRFSPKHQRLFNSRVMKFIKDKNFEGRDNQQVTIEMKVLIAATAVRVTWGLNYYIFPSFHSILIYPEQFYSGFSKAVVRGETNMAGVIVFSWKDFLFGVSDQNDNLNLGYHEFGHALFVERFKETVDNSFIENYDRWRRLIIKDGKLKEAELKHTFRKYATFNEHEFFAVAVENFFERPEKFRNDLPKLYKLMAAMLNQDPLAYSQQYDQRSF